MGSARAIQELPRVRVGPVAGQSRANKRWCLRLCGSTFKKGEKNPAAEQQLGEREQGETALQTPRSENKEGERCSRCQSRSPLRPVVRTTVKQAVPLQPVEYHSGAGFHAAARGRDPGGAGAESDQEGAAETKGYRLTAAPIPPLPCAARGRGGGRGRTGGGRRFWFLCFLSPFSIFLLIGNKSY